MRKLILILVLLALVGAAHAATRIEAWLTITNLPNGSTQSLTWNGASNRLWTNIIFNASTMIQTTNNIQNSRTNLKVQLDTYKFRNWHVVNYGTNTNDVVILAGTNEPIAIAIAGLWASVRYVTNTAYISDFVLAPPHSGQSNNFLIWQWTAVGTNLSKGTQALESTSFPFTNFPHTLRTSNPPMTNMNTSGGTNYGGVSVLGSGQFINVGLSNAAATNFSSISGSFLNANSITGIAVRATTAADLTGVLMRSGNATGTVAHFTTLRGTTLTTLGAGIIGSDLIVTNELSVGSDAAFAAAVNINSTANVKDLNVTGTNNFALAVAFMATNITSLANGANLMDPGLKTFIRVSGPSAAYSLDKITRGYDGRFIRVHKNDSFTLTLANESGSGGGAATDRLVTGTGANITVTNNPGVVEFTYDATLGRWVLGYHSL